MTGSGAQEAYALVIRDPAISRDLKAEKVCKVLHGKDADILRAEAQAWAANQPESGTPVSIVVVAGTAQSAPVRWPAWTLPDCRI